MPTYIYMSVHDVVATIDRPLIILALLLQKEKKDYI